MATKNRNFLLWQGLSDMSGPAETGGAIMRVLMDKVFTENQAPSLHLMWQAYLRSCAKVVENQNQESTGLVYCYLYASFDSTEHPTTVGAGIGVGYLNARYYNPSQGQFISQDPIFQQLGSTQGEKLANRTLQEILKDPQSLNNYSYAKNNPISIKDPSGLMDSKTATVLGLYAQVLNLLSQIIVLSSGGGGASAPYSTTATMFAQSTKIDPPKSLNITPGNQQYYGNVVNKIQKSDDFNAYVKKQIDDNGVNGTINVPADPAHSFNFNSGDLYWSLHDVKAGLSGKQGSDGTWNIQVNIQDKYNFEYKNYGSSVKSAGASTINNSALVPQAAGVISPYDISIKFGYTYNPQ